MAVYDNQKKKGMTPMESFQDRRTKQSLEDRDGRMGTSSGERLMDRAISMARTNQHQVESALDAITVFIDEMMGCVPEVTDNTRSIDAEAPLIEVGRGHQLNAILVNTSRQMERLKYQIDRMDGL